MRFLIRTDGNPVIGSGHIARTLNVAHGLLRHGHEVHFAIRNSDTPTEQLLEIAGYPTHRLYTVHNPQPAVPNDYLSWIGGNEEADALEIIDLVNVIKADAVIVDHYGATSNWDSIIADRGVRLVVIDDFVARPRQCDVLIVPSLIHVDRTSVDLSRVGLPLLGPQFAPLHDDFASWRSLDVPRSSLSVYLGGSPSSDLYARIYEEVQSVAMGRVVELAGAPSKLRLLDSSLGSNTVRVIPRQPSLAPLLSRSLVSIGAAGSTTWERCCLGVPSLVVSVSDNQTHIAKDVALVGAHVDLGPSSQLKPGALSEALANLLENPDEMLEMSAIGKTLVDGRGVERIVDALSRIRC